MKNYLSALVLMLIILPASAQKKHRTDVLAYYAGDTKKIDQYDVKKLTHIIYSFCHLKDDKLFVRSTEDSLTIKKLVSLKKQNPDLKVMLSLGGWGGCAPCSEAFSRKNGRETFARSVKELNDYFQTDGIDLDWEYPTIEGHPGHLYQSQDKANFTALVKELRKVLGKKNELSFAAGGFQKFLDESVDWKAIMPLMDRVNIMSYDLVNGYSTTTGHHTPLYSTHEKEESTDRAVQYLLKLGIPSSKLVIGAAFYTRVWKNVPDAKNGLYQSGEHTNGVNFRNYAQTFTPENGWQEYWDDQAKANYWYNLKEQRFATGDSKKSVTEKTRYAKNLKLGGIMFWELTLDTSENGLLDTIYEEVKR